MRFDSIVGYGKTGFILLLLALSPAQVVLAGADEGEGDHQAMEGMQHGDAHDEGSGGMAGMQHDAGDKGNGGMAGMQHDAGDKGNGGMAGMHHGKITVPKEYLGKENPYWTDLDAIIEGHQIFQTNCALCHGKKGRGDGVLSPTLDPKPADFTKSEHMAMMSGDYLFWRVSEGGAFAPFDSAMPSFKTTLTDDERWKVLAYEHAISHAILLDHKAGETIQPRSQAPAH